MNQNKHTPKIKIANSLYFLTAQTFLFCFHCGTISTLSSNTKVAIFPDKRISLGSITFTTTILVESFMTGSSPFWLKLETHNFTFKINFYTNQEKPKRFSCRKRLIFLTRLISCYYFGFIGLLSVSCVFYDLLVTQRVKIFTA